MYSMTAVSCPGNEDCKWQIRLTTSDWRFRWWLWIVVSMWVALREAAVSDDCEDWPWTDDCQWCEWWLNDHCEWNWGWRLRMPTDDWLMTLNEWTWIVKANVDCELWLWMTVHKGCVVPSTVTRQIQGCPKVRSETEKSWTRVKSGLVSATRVKLENSDKSRVQLPKSGKVRKKLSGWITQLQLWVHRV
jgi:hypothetical protein